jgi:hypothetical protein
MITGQFQPQSKEVRAQGWSDSGCGQQALAGRADESTASDGREESGEGGPAQPSPALQLPRTQDPGPEQCLVHQRVCRQLGEWRAGRAKSNSGRHAGRQAGGRALQIRNA